MDSLMEEAIGVQKDFKHHTDESKKLGPKRNKLIVRLAKSHTKAEIAANLEISSQRVIQILKKEGVATKDAKPAK